MKIKNVSGTDLTVPWLRNRLVVDEQEVPVPEGTVFAYTQQEATWVPADDEAQAEHDEGLEACVYALALQGRLVEAPEAAVEQSARQLVADVATATTDQAAELIDAERARPKPRPTVIAAAEQRIVELAELDANNNAGDAGNGDEDR